MEDKFKHIDVNNKKVKNIINSSFEEFSKYDFDKASTNNIVKKACVSRGLLYHYFKDKQELYDFLLIFSIKINAENMEKKINWEESDFLNRIRQGLVAKIEVSSSYPYLFDFYKKIRNSKEAKRLESKVELYYPGFTNKFYSQNIDFSCIKDGVDIDKMINVIVWTLKQLGKNFWDEIQDDNSEFDSDEFLRQCDSYLDFFKDLFYK